MKYRDEQLRQILAAEYALGTLPLRARRRFERLLATDRRLRRELAAWEQRLGALHGGFPPQAPRDIVWSGLEGRLQRQRAVSLPPAIPITADRRPLRLWRAGALAASLAAAALGYGLWREQAEGPQVIERVRTERVEVPVIQPVYVALLQSEAPAQWLVMIRPDRRTLTVACSGRYPMDAARQALQLWLLDEAGAAHAMGMLPDSGVAEMPLPMPLPAQPMLAVSLEPKDGSPSGQPSGPMVSQAPLLPL